MNPPNAGGLRRDGQIRMQKPLIETVARAKHQSMLSKSDGPLVAVSRQVSNNKNGHESGSTKITQEPLYTSRKGGIRRESQSRMKCIHRLESKPTRVVGVRVRRGRHLD